MAIGPDGAAFPALDSVLTLSRAGETTTVLALDGVYRLPGQAAAGLDPASVRCFAAVTIRSFIARLACIFMHPAGSAVLVSSRAAGTADAVSLLIAIEVERRPAAVTGPSIQSAPPKADTFRTANPGNITACRPGDFPYSRFHRPHPAHRADRASAKC